MRRIHLIVVASMIAAVATIAGAGTLPKGNTFGGVAGGGGLSQAAGDARYLKIDASNDPLTSSLDITQSTAGTVGMVVTNINAGANARTRLDLYAENATMWQECRPAAATGTFQDATNADICLIGTEAASSLAIGTFDAVPMYFGTNDTLAMTVEADQDIVMAQDVAMGTGTGATLVTLGGGTDDAVDINADDVEFVNDTVVTLTGGVDGLEFNGGDVDFRTNAQGTAETVARFGVNDAANDYITIKSRSTTAGQFGPTIDFFMGSTDANNSAYFISQIAAASDSGSVGVFRLQGYRTTPAVVSTRPLLQIQNYTTDSLTLSASGRISPLLYGSLSNCTDSAGDAACSAAPAGAFVIDAADTNTVVSTTAMTANSQVFVQFDSSLGTRLSVTCNTTWEYPQVTARSAGASFTVTVGDGSGPVTNPACFSYFIVN